MNEKKKAEALSQSLDALLRGEESASSISADEEIRALSELGYSLHNIEFEPSPAHQAAVERLLQKHRVDCERSATTGTSDPSGLTAREVKGKTPATARFLPRRLIPLAVLSGGVALLFICALVVLIGGGLAWRAFRDTDSVFVSEAPASHDVWPSPSPTSETSVAQSPSPSPSPTSERSLAQNPTPDLEAELSHTVFLPAVINPLPPQSAVLKDIRGVVEIRADGDTWTLVREGRVIKAGQRVRTGALSSASLAFYDGSTAYLGPNTEVSVENLDQDPTDGSRIVELTQWVGQTDHDVASAYGDHARYEVHTPSGTGEAKGTRFHVLVTPALVVRFSVDQGAVAVTNLNVTVVVVAGQLTVIEADQVPSQPVFRVTGEGEVTQTGTTWTIAGQDFETHDGTVIIGNPQVGDWVSVAGHLLADGTRVADRIALLRRSPANRFTLIGEVDAIEDTAWTVAGQTITVDEETAIEEGIEIDDVVRVEGVLLEDGALLAERIRLVEEEPGLPFHFVGVLQGIDDETWAISGISITVDADTELDEDLVAGDVVEVRGWILEDGTWLARSIGRVEEDEGKFAFTGYVDSIAPWVVSGIAFETKEWTEIESGIGLGDRVRVKGRILQDGTWVAVEIKRLDDEEALYFEFVGTVDSVDPWAVSGIPLVVDDETEVKGDVTVGDLVKVEGRILPDGRWLAKRITRIGIWPGLDCLSFSTIVVGIDADVLVLPNGETIHLSEDAAIEGEVTVGSIIMVFICVDADGTITVVAIVVIYQLPPVIIPSPTRPPGDDDDKITICHKPNSKSAHTITVSRSAVQSHLDHGDTLGPCPGHDDDDDDDDHDDYDDHDDDDDHDDHDDDDDHHDDDDDDDDD